MSDVESVDETISFQTLTIRFLMEFGAVIFQLICFSRLGSKDYYYLVNQKADFAEYDNSQLEPSLAANFVLFVTLIIFQFPYLNGYILFMYDTCVIGRTSVQRVGSCLIVVASQVLAVLVVWGIIRGAQEQWKGTITWIVPQVQATDEGRDFGAEFVEELIAVIALLVGYIHLTYLNYGPKQNDPGLFGSPVHTFSEFPRKVLEFPIPMSFIAQITLLVAGLLRAFPTSHLSPHISCYILAMGYTTWYAFLTRMAGGLVGFGISYLLYWYGFVPRHDALQNKFPPFKHPGITYFPYRSISSKSNAALDNTFAISFHNTPRHVYTI